jgi:protease YdgD
VFTITDGVAQVVSVISAKAEVNGRKVALAVPVSGPLAALLGALEDSKAGSSERSGAVTVLSGGNGAGAKFVKP